MSKEYIEREAAISALVDNIGDINIRTAIAAGCIIGRVPAAPVREITKGKWRGTGFVKKACKCKGCSNCGAILPVGNFCLSCGANMKEGEQNG